MPNFLSALRAKQAAAATVPPRATFEQQILSLAGQEVAIKQATASAQPSVPDHLQPPHVVFQQYAPLINREVGRWEASGLPRVVLEAEAKRLVARALPSFDPSKGANLATHLTNHLRKLDGFVGTHKPDVRMSLDRTYMRNKAIAAQADLRLELGAEPTHEQIAQRLGVTATRVADLQRAQTNLYSSVEAAGQNQPLAENTGHSEIVLNFLHHDLQPTHKVVFEHTVGFRGAPVLTGQELADKLKVPPARVQAMRTEIAAQMQRYTRAVEGLRD